MHTEWIEVRPAKVKKGRLPTEGTLIAKRLVPQDYIIALDRSGKEYDFEGLATPIEQLSYSRNRLTFIVGGPLGHSQQTLNKTHEIFWGGAKTCRNLKPELVVCDNRI